MGFFKKLFKRKKGGTFFGNLIRGVSNKASGGILGSGSGLAAWEEKQALKEQQAMINQQARARHIGGKIGSQLKPHVDKAMQSKEAKDIEKAFTAAWFKKNWLKVIIPVVLLTILIIWLVRRGNNPRRRRRSRR